MINNYESKTFLMVLVMFKPNASSFSLMPAKAKMEDWNYKLFITLNLCFTICDDNEA